MAKNSEYFKQMNRSEKKIEERIRAELAKTKITDPDVFEDKIIEMEQHQKELTDEIDRIKRILKENGISPNAGKGLGVDIEYRIKPTGTVSFGGVPPQPTTRLGR